MSNLKSTNHWRGWIFISGTFTVRCVMFCSLWVGTNWMYMHALSILDATDVMALFATNVSFVYLLSWVILHEQFVGLRVIAAVIRWNDKQNKQKTIDYWSFVVRLHWLDLLTDRRCDFLQHGNSPTCVHGRHQQVADSGRGRTGSGCIRRICCLQGNRWIVITKKHLDSYNHGRLHWYRYRSNEYSEKRRTARFRSSSLWSVC